MQKITKSGQHPGGTKIWLGQMPQANIASYSLLTTRRIGGLLFGSQPEVIKQLMSEGKDVPQNVVLNSRFVVEGSSMNEVEFLLYYNFFVKSRKLKLIGTQIQLNRIRVILSESLFGPKETTDGRDKEREYLRVRDKTGRPLILEDFADFVTLKNDKEAVVEGVRIIMSEKNVFHTFEDGKLLGITYMENYIPLKEMSEPIKETSFTPPKFGVTFIGTSTGFDPSGHTTSFVLWANGKGIFVDPPADPIGNLRKLGISINDIDHIILTHCHADHDAGTIDAIMSSGKRLKLITSGDIFRSYSRKFSAMALNDLKEHVDFIQLDPGKNIEVHGIKITAHSTFHSIPTIGFKAECSQGGTSYKIAYSSDTIYNPKLLSELKEKGVFDDERLAELLKFVEDGDYDLLINEAGEPPIHTPSEVLAALPDEIKKKMLIVHTGKVKEGLELNLAQTGDTIEVVPSSAGSGPLDLQH